ncbi:RidA family protein [Rhizobium multihospitium]|uniref:Enamine deaminase RidA, house cleaning of reactive enamine intermediates, YjgF/YER057c/UK114 family n=1 Tax=Rhizobium multihospitium TaxID=410764 RepID=A0A1C3VX50_9HYPH|nr:RidA family protein [Rhizobium multihospitium]SCB32215.1 Enamine deaminase RidA, house cleaning of reactive enamine intermediates, YjgF/YER057c/UK114 family [Rhizobium multihospitium]
MTEIVKVKSGSILEDKEGYSRIVAVGDWIFMSLTAGRDYKTRAMPDTAVEQARQAMKNVEGALDAVGASLADIVRRRIFIPRQEDVPDVMAYMGEKFRGIDPASCVSCGPLGGPEYLFEIEITAYRGAGAKPAKQISISL